MSVFCTIDDKYVPVYRILWIAAVPHFCGSEECAREGQYEVRLEAAETVWANRDQRDAVLAALETWQRKGPGPDGEKPFSEDDG
jgi:hypothetical protein